jgi:type IV secretory pathway VirB10-like protein
MRPNQQNNKNRSRGRNNNGGRKHGNPLSRNYESNGPDVKVRGNAAHIAEKYLQLARDAQSSGDSVMAENYLQHAEHYFRIISAAQQAQQAQFRGETAEEDDYDDDFAPINDRFASPEPRQPFQPPQQQGGGGNANNPNQQQPQQQYSEQPSVQSDAGEAQPAEASAPSEGGEAQAAEGDGAPRRRDRRPRRRSRGGGGNGEGGAEGSDPAGAPQPDIGLPAFLTAGSAAAE